MKLSTIWEDFDEFMDLCLTSGTNDTKHRLKIIKTFFNDENKFEGNWQNLFDNIIYIFVNDKKIAYKFDYSKPFIVANQEMFSEKNPTSYGVRKGLFEKLQGQAHGTQMWNSPTEFYKTSDKIWLSKTLNTDKPIQCEIIGTSLRQLQDMFDVIVDKNKILIQYNNNVYSSAINAETLRKVQISKYPEIIRFINAKYYGLYLNKLSYNSFKYLVLSFSDIKPFLLVPTNNNGYLSSSLTSQYIKSLSEANEYFKSVDEKFENIRFTYKTTAFNKFEIVRPENKSLQKAIADTENSWGKARSVNKSRKGNIITPKI